MDNIIVAHVAAPQSSQTLQHMSINLTHEELIVPSICMALLSFPIYRVLQLNPTPEIEVFYMLFDRSLSIFSMTFLTQ